MTDVILGAIILAPLVLTFLLRSNAALTFLAASTGYVLVTYVSSDLRDSYQDMGFGGVDGNILSLILLFAPPAVTLFLTRHSVANRSRIWLQAVIALSVGGLLAITGIPIVGQVTELELASSEVWSNLQKYQAAVIGIGAALSLVLIWLANLKPRGHKKH